MYKNPNTNITSQPHSFATSYPSKPKISSSPYSPKQPWHAPVKSVAGQQTACSLKLEGWCGAVAASARFLARGHEAVVVLALGPSIPVRRLLSVARCFACVARSVACCISRRIACRVSCCVVSTCLCAVASFLAVLTLISVLIRSSCSGRCGSLSCSRRRTCNCRDGLSTRVASCSSINVSLDLSSQILLVDKDLRSDRLGCLSGVNSSWG